MIRDLDATIQAMLETLAPPGSELDGADIAFDVPDAEWRASLSSLTVNCYLYDVRENLDLRTNERLIQRSDTGVPIALRRPPVRIDCTYCITAWSPATAESVLEEHRLLSQVLRLLLQNPTIPSGVLQGSLATQIPPFPRLIAAPDGIKNSPEFWGALDQQLKPSLSYTITLAMLLDDEPPAGTVLDLVQEVNVDAEAEHLADDPSLPLHNSPLAQYWRHQRTGA
jgi:hypothetical protein